MSIHTQESLKEKATVIRKFLKEKSDVNISHGHSLELISKVFGFKDWNTASALSISKEKQDFSPVKIKTIGDMRKALEPFDNSARIDANYEFKIKDFEIDPLTDPEDEINQEFSFSLDDFSNTDIVCLKLQLEHESLTQRHRNYMENRPKSNYQLHLDHGFDKIYFITGTYEQLQLIGSKAHLCKDGNDQKVLQAVADNIILIGHSINNIAIIFSFIRQLSQDKNLEEYYRANAKTVDEIQHLVHGKKYAFITPNDLSLSLT